jgi:tetratricopeptide (TPR) repeat protein
VRRDRRDEPDLAPGPARELVALFRRLRRSTWLSVGQIAVRAGLSAGHVSEVLRGWKAPSPHAAAAVARALGADDRTALKARRLAEDLAELNQYNRARARSERLSPGDDSPAVFLRRRLPDFLGRDRELGRITEMLGRRDLGSPVVVLYGMGGVGKTALANELAYRAGGSFTAARIFVDLGGAGMPETRLGDAFQQIFYALGATNAEIPEQPAQQALLLQKLLARGPCLLILDNVTRAGQVASLLPAVPGCAAILTSRSPLLSLDGVRRVSVQPLPDSAALELFLAVLGEDYGPANPDAARRTVDLLSGLPLAIRIAAATASGQAMRGQPLSALATRLADESERLGSLEDGERGVRASFDVSYRALPAAVAQFFRLLGMLPVAEADIGLLAAAADVSAKQARGLASALVDAQLIDTIGPFAQRYRLHDLVKLYAREIAVRADSEEFRASLLERVLDWYADAASRTLDPPSAEHQPSEAALSWFAREHANAVAVTRAAYEASDWDRLLRLSEAIRPLLWYRKRWQDLALTEEWAVQAAQHAGGGRSEIRAIIYLAEARRISGRPQMTASLYERALQLSRRENDGLEAWITTHYGDSFLDLDRPETAIEYYESALSQFREAGDDASEVWLAAHFIDAYLQAGRLGDAIRIGEEALALARRMNDPPGEIWVRWHLAQAYRNVGRFEEAIDALTAAANDSRARHDLGAATHMLMLLGETQKEAGLTTEAKATLEEARRYGQGVGIKPLEERITRELAELTGTTDVGQSGLKIRKHAEHALRDPDAEDEA